MSNYQKHAFAEFKAAGWLNEDGTYKDEMQGMICDNILKLLEVFDDEGHSGSSAPYTIKLFSRLAMFEPIAPLTGEDWEWSDCGRDGDIGGRLYQNRRASHVFKNDTGAWDINGKVFWEWNCRPLDEDEEGYPGTKTYKSYYSNGGCHTPVTFPYSPPDKPIYEYRYSDAEPTAPPQTEAGLL